MVIASKTTPIAALRDHDEERELEGRLKCWLGSHEGNDPESDLGVTVTLDYVGRLIII